MKYLGELLQVPLNKVINWFTILLVFLLQTFASGEVQIEPVNNLRLPTSTTEKNPIDGVHVSISQNELKIDEKLLAHVQNNEVEKVATNVEKDLEKVYEKVENKLENVATNLEKDLEKEVKETVEEIKGGFLTKLFACFTNKN